VGREIVCHKEVEMNLKIVPAYNLKKEIKSLFTEYTNLLIEGDSTFREYLEVQDYDKELADLEVKYGQPQGRLYVAYRDDELAGCVGLRKIDAQNCEMKRLYVKEEFRGKGIGDTLAKLIIAEAKKQGYSHMLLDTLPFLETAIHMYRSYGFYEIECYNNCPMDNVIYMKLDL